MFYHPAPLSWFCQVLRPALLPLAWCGRAPPPEQVNPHHPFLLAQVRVEGGGDGLLRHLRHISDRLGDVLLLQYGKDTQVKIVS